MEVRRVVYLPKKNIIVVRKQKDGYSDFLVEGPSSKCYIIIDDLICSGGTVKHIMKNIRREAPRSKCVGVYCYMPEESSYRNCPEYCKRDLGIPYLSGVAAGRAGAKCLCTNDL